MPLYSSDALILRTYKLGEADRIVVFLTRDRGKKRGVAKGARRPRSPFVGALEPLTQARVAYFEKERRELVSLNYSEPSRSPFSSGTVEALGCAAYFADLIDEWAPDAHADERLYRLGASMVDALAAGVPPEPLARYFEYWLLRLQGVYPPHVVCERCAKPLEDIGGFVAASGRAFRCPECGSNAPAVDAVRSVSPGALAFLTHAERRRPSQLSDLAVSRGVLRELEALHRSLIRLHLEREPRSMKVLREMNRS